MINNNNNNNNELQSTLFRGNSIHLSCSSSQSKGQYGFQVLSYICIAYISSSHYGAFSFSLCLHNDHHKDKRMNTTANMHTSTPSVKQPVAIPTEHMTQQQDSTTGLTHGTAVLEHSSEEGQALGLQERVPGPIKHEDNRMRHLIQAPLPEKLLGGPPFLGEDGE